MNKQDQRYSDENQVNFALLNENNDGIYKKTTVVRAIRPSSYEFTKLALIIFTASVIITTMGIFIVYLMSNKESNYNLDETPNKNNQPVSNTFQELRADLEEWPILTEKSVNPELNPKIDVHLIVEQMIVLKKDSLKVLQKEDDILRTTTMRGTTTTTTAPKIIDYLLMTIVINKATVPNTDKILLGRTDAFVKAFVDNRFIGQTPTRKNTLDPVWNYQIIQDLKIETNSILEFEVWDSDKYTTNELIDRTQVRMSELMSKGLKGKVVYKEYGNGYRLWFTINWEEVYKKA